MDVSTLAGSMIREAVETDSKAIATLSGQLGYSALPSEIRDRLKRIQKLGDSQVFVAEIEGTVVGWVHIYGAHVLESPAHAEIGGLVVDESHRGRGIGRELMAEAERWAASMRYATVRLRSNLIRETAHSFYKRLGYSETKRQAVFTKALAVEESRETGPPGAS